jgi:hypothetical protein
LEAAMRGYAMNKDDHGDHAAMFRDRFWLTLC